MPSLLATTISFFTLVAVLPVCLPALIYFVETSLTHGSESNSFSKLLLPLHFGDQQIIQFLRRIVAGLLELGLKRGDFHQAREVTPRPHGDNHVRNVHAQNLRVLFFHP